MTVLHASDLHFGAPHLSQVADTLIQFALRRDIEVVVLSGDLTQRAKVREYRAARTFLDRLAPIPVIAVPGNHDVPLYRFWERLLRPYRNYRAHIGPESDSVLDVEGQGGRPRVRFVALNTALPRRAIVAGGLSKRQLALAERACRSAPPGARRVLILHHHLIALDRPDAPKPLRGTARLLARLGDWRVNLVLAGHVHETHYGAVPFPGQGDGALVPVVVAGTATSTRGRGLEEGQNAFNLVRIQNNGIRVARYLYNKGARRFVPAGDRAYPGPPGPPE